MLADVCGEYSRDRILDGRSVRVSATTEWLACSVVGICPRKQMN